MAITRYDYQDGVLSVHTTDAIATVLTDGYLNDLRSVIIHDGARPKISSVDGLLTFSETRTMLDIDQVLRVYIGNEIYELIVTALLPDVATKKYEDAQIRADISQLQTGIGITPATGVLTITVPDNSLVFFVAPVNATYDGWQFVTDDDTEPLYDASTWNTGQIPTQSNGTTIPNLADWTTAEKRYTWLRSGTTVTQLKPASTDPKSDGATVPGVIIQANPIDPPIKISDFSASAGTNAATDVNYSFSATTILDGLTLQYDFIYFAADGTITTLTSDVTPGSLSYTALSPDSTYQLAIAVYPNGDPDGATSTRASISNIEVFTTGTAASNVGSITSVTVTDISEAGGGPSSTPIVVVVDDGAIDEIYVKVDDATEPGSTDTAWETLSVGNGWTESPALTWTGTLAGADTATYGPHVAYVRCRKSTAPTAYTAVNSDAYTATDTTASGALGWTQSTLTVSEVGSPKTSLQAYLSRNDTTGVATVDVTTSVASVSVPAIEGNDGNYHALSTTISWSAGNAAPDDDPVLEILFSNLGFDYREVDVVLSNATGSFTIGTDTLRIRINGTYGYVPYTRSGGTIQDIDLNHPPLGTLTNLTGQQTITTAGSPTYYEHQNIDQGGTQQHGIFINGRVGPFGTLNIENCVIHNCGGDGVYGDNVDGTVNFRNVLIYDCGKNPPANPANSGHGIYMQHYQFTGTNTVSVVGCKGYDFICLAHLYGDPQNTFGAFNTMHLTEMNWNYREQISTRLGRTGAHLTQLSNMRFMANPEVIGNVVYSPNSFGGQSWGDGINTFKSGCTSGNPGLIQHNYLYMADEEPRNSATMLILGDGANGDAYWQAEYNTLLHGGVAGIGVAGGIGNIARYNNIYKPSTQSPLNINGVGIYANRQFGTDAGEFYTTTAGPNRVLWHNTTSGKNNTYSPSLAFDGLWNHGATAPHSNPTNWSLNQDMETHWGGGLGEIILGECRVILRQPANAEGVFVDSAYATSAVGHGRLLFTYNGGSGQTLSWAERGGSYGLAIDVTTPQTLYDTTQTGSKKFRLVTGGASGNYITVVIRDSSAWPTADTVWSIPVGKQKKRELFVYPGPNGDWTGFSDSGTTPTDTEGPTTPQNLTQTGATETTITMDVADSTDAIGTVVKYEWERDGVFLIDTLTSVLTADSVSSGATHVYRVRAWDNSGNPSEWSTPYTATASAGSFILVGGEFDTDAADNTAFDAAYTNWTRNNVDCVVSSGELTVTNNTAAAGNLYYVGIGAIASATSYTLSLNEDNNPASCFIDMDSASAGAAWGSGDMIQNQSANNPTLALTEKVSNNSTSTNLYLTLWVNSSTNGDGFKLQYARLALT